MVLISQLLSVGIDGDNNDCLLYKQFLYNSYRVDFNGNEKMISCKSPTDFPAQVLFTFEVHSPEFQNLNGIADETNNDKDDDKPSTDDEIFDHDDRLPSILSDDSIQTKEERKQLSVFGYIRQILKETEYPVEFIDNIAKLIIEFYPLNDIKWSRNDKECSAFRHFNSDKGIKRADVQFGCCSCFINTVITNTMCAKFDIEFIVRPYGEYEFYIGYITSLSALYDGSAQKI